MACISGYTNGVYSYVDCCGLTRVGVSSGETVCLDQSYSGSAVNIVYDTGSTCTQACSGTSELSYFFTVTGTCGIANGAVTITPNGGYPPYTIDPIFPVGHGLSAQTGTTSITFTGLTDETYVFRLNDSLGDVNSELFINVSVGNCFSATTTSVEGTTCGLENGFISVSGSSTTPPYNILLYKDEVLNQIQQTTSVPYNFPELSEGIYYALLVDSSNVTAKTENVVISASTQLDFGLWKVDTSQCATDKGKISVTGQTGECPYTYLWSDGQTGQTITGLTVGEYSVTVTDNQGCELTKSIFVDIASPLGVGLVTGTNPTCFSSNGVIDITITGGSVPYYYSASSGNIGVTLSNQLSITGLSAGDYQIIIKDANLCTLDVITELNSVNGFRNVSNVITNSTCSFDNGLVQTTIVGSYGFYSYTLSGQNTNQIFTKFTQDQNVTFDGLQTDTYLLTISGESSSCVYTESLEVTSESKFTVTATTTPSSCGSQNGSISVNVSTGYTEPIDYVLSNGNTLQNVNFSSYTFNFLTPGNYTLQVTDADNCTVSLDLTVPLSGNLISTLTKTDCTNNNDGAATVTIFDGAPPFTFDWSENVPSGSTGSTVTGLSGGSYSVTVSDNSGCTEFWTFDIVCNQFLVTGRTRYNVVNQKFDTLTGTKRSIQKMINEGFFDLINLSGYSNCILNKVQLEALVTINGSTSGQTFTYADDYSWQHAIEDILDTIPEVNSYSISALNNTLEITCDCSSISSNYFKIELEITYDIKCSQLTTPTPTPTPSPTPTPTYVPTATPTATPTPTPTSSGIVWFTNLDIYNIADEDVCEDTVCNRSLYSTGSTINIGDIIYTDPLLTTKYVGTNFGPTDGFARVYVSSTCPITTRNVLQVNDLGVVLSKYTC